MFFNRHLKQIIKARYGTQLAFCRSLGINAPFASNVIRGRVNLTLAEQEQWADALGCSREELFDTPEGPTLPSLAGGAGLDGSALSAPPAGTPVEGAAACAGG